MSRTSLIRLPLAKRAEVFPLLEQADVPLCSCCRHCELDRDKQDKPWLIVQTARHPRNQRREPCRRCGQPCANARCASLPPNPSTGVYGLGPRRRRNPLRSLFR